MRTAAIIGCALRRLVGFRLPVVKMNQNELDLKMANGVI